MTDILLVAGLTLAGSFLCSLFEATLYSITPSQLAVLKGRQKGASKLAKLKEKMDQPMAAILTLNTINHTVGSAACGAMVAERYGSAAVGVFATLFTLAVLLVTEIVPKSLGVRYAVAVGPLMAWPLQVMIWLVWPVVKGSSWLMSLLARSHEQRSPTEDEVMAMSRMAVLGGELRPQELKWVENALRLDRIHARDLMTPRTVVQTLPEGLKLEELRAWEKPWQHSRIPVTEGGDPDRIRGLVLRRDILEALVDGRRELTLSDLKQPIAFVPEAMPGHRLLDKFLKEKNHLVAVVDEYGGFEGVVTLEDVLECLIGSEIVDEHDEVADLQEFARERAHNFREESSPGGS